MAAVRVGTLGCAGFSHFTGLLTRVQSPPVRLAANYVVNSFNEMRKHAMKKLVPDPPTAFCVSPDLSREDAINRAAEYLNKAILQTAYLPDPPEMRHQQMLSNALFNMRITKALLGLAATA